MSERTRTAQSNPDLVQYSQGDLEAALNDFLKEQEPPQKINLFNFKTIAGMSMLFITTLFLIQQLIPWFGFPIDSDFVQILPVFGGILVALTGLGLFSGRKKQKKSKAKFEPVAEKPLTLNDLNDKSTLDSYALNQSKRLYRSRRDKRFLGVCGGIAKYFGLNPFAVRLLWAILTLSSGGIMIPLYIVMAIIMPKEPPIFQIPYNK
jgi:phage shock protein C